jgi:hypothetical protein
MGRKACARRHLRRAILGDRGEISALHLPRHRRPPEQGILELAHRSDSSVDREQRGVHDAGERGGDPWRTVLQRWNADLMQRENEVG